MDLIIVGAIIKDHKMIETAIASAPEYPFSKKYILFDGPAGPKDAGSLMEDVYFAYTKYIENKYPDFLVIRFSENVYFREMINYITTVSESERLFIIQDDVQCHSMDLKQIEIQMNSLKNCKILCFPHKYIRPEGTHWYEIMDDAYPIPFIKSHGFSERVFICDRLRMMEITNELPKKTWRTQYFIEFIYQNAMKSAEWRDASDNKKEHYWDMWGTYFHHDIFHTHLCAKRKIT